MGIEYRMDTLLANLVYLQALTETLFATVRWFFRNRGRRQTLRSRAYELQRSRISLPHKHSSRIEVELNQRSFHLRARDLIDESR
jgi:hypothetical protein